MALLAALALFPVPVLFPAQALARESFATVPSAQLVSSFFDSIIKIVFLDQTGPAMQIAALRDVLARSTDAEKISRFILGRFGHDQKTSGAGESTNDPANGFLDFAAVTVMRMTPRHDAGPDPLAQPKLVIVTMTMRSDKTRLVQSDLILPNGRQLPLTWEIAERPTGLRIEDVTCLGISLRLMLRSAVAEAAAEHPEDAHDLGHLLQADKALAQFSGPTRTP